MLWTGGERSKMHVLCWYSKTNTSCIQWKTPLTPLLLGKRPINYLLADYCFLFSIFAYSIPINVFWLPSDYTKSYIDDVNVPPRRYFTLALGCQRNINYNNITRPITSLKKGIIRNMLVTMFHFLNPILKSIRADEKN